MKTLALSIAMLLNVGSAAAMPCIMTYEEYRLKLLNSSFSAGTCEEHGYWKPHNLEYELCINNLPNKRQVVAVWKKAVENSSNDVVDILFPVIFTPPHRFCLIPNTRVESSTSVNRLK